MKHRRILALVVSFLLLFQQLPLTALAEGEHEHVTEYQARIEPSCVEEGVEAHWVCTVCGETFLDEAATEPASFEDLLLPLIDHELVHHDAQEPGCEDGNAEYWQCSMCEACFLHEDDAEDVDFAEMIRIPGDGHSAEFVEQALPSGEDPGHVAHYRCTVCGKTFLDDDLTMELADVTPAAQVGDMLFASLMDALYASEEGLPITVLKNISESGEDYYREVSEPLVLDLGGHTVSFGHLTVYPDLQLKNGSISAVLEAPDLGGEAILSLQNVTASLPGFCWTAGGLSLTGSSMALTGAVVLGGGESFSLSLDGSSAITLSGELSSENPALMAQQLRPYLPYGVSLSDSLEFSPSGSVTLKAYLDFVSFTWTETSATGTAPRRIIAAAARPSLTTTRREPSRRSPSAASPPR